MSSRTSQVNWSASSWDLTGDGIRTEGDATYRSQMLKNIEKGYTGGWIKP